MLAERERCPECRAYDGHHPICKLASMEYKADQLEGYYRMWLEEHRRYGLLCERHKKDVTFWQGKFHMVRHENNTLRKKLNKNDRGTDVSTMHDQGAG